MRRAIQLQIQLAGMKKVVPEVYSTLTLREELLRLARTYYKVGDVFLWSRFRFKVENEEGVHPEDQNQGYQHASSYLTKRGFERVGELGKSIIRSRGNARDAEWRRVW